MIGKKVFNYDANNEFDGLFAYMRNYHDDYNEFVNIFTKTENYVNNACVGVVSADKTALIDGDNYTSWGNYENDISYAYVIFKFPKKAFCIRGIAIQTMCCHPQEVEIDASNEESFDKYSILSRIQMDSNDKSYHSEFENYNIYQYIRIRMTEPNKCGVLYRMQLKEIEVFGILEPHYIKLCSCAKPCCFIAMFFSSFIYNVK